jgi:ribosomal protein S18 acetylase RimI-like enzyme
MKIFVNVFHKAYGGADQNEPYGNLPKGYSKCVEKAFMKNRRNPINYIGFLNDKPVGIGSMIRSGRFAGIYNIGVIPCARKNGIGSLMTLNAVNNAIKHKANIIFLQTVADSYNEKLYKRIGFKTEFVGESFVLGD